MRSGGNLMRRLLLGGKRKDNKKKITDDEKFYTASQAKLILLKFLDHKIAVLSVVLLVVGRRTSGQRHCEYLDAGRCSVRWRRRRLLRRCDRAAWRPSFGRFVWFHVNQFGLPLVGAFADQRDLALGVADRLLRVPKNLRPSAVLRLPVVADAEIGNALDGFERTNGQLVALRAAQGCEAHHVVGPQ